MKKMIPAFDQLISGTNTNAKKNTGIKKNEKGKRSNCMVDAWMINGFEIN